MNEPEISSNKGEDATKLLAFLLTRSSSEAAPASALNYVVCVGVMLVHLVFVFFGFDVAIDNLIADLLAAGLRLGLTAH